jgi:hypothetical protein
MIVVAPDPSLDEIYPIDGIDWGRLIIACSVFDVPLFITSKIESDESEDIGVFIHRLDDRRMVDILYKGHVVLDNVNEFGLHLFNGFLDTIGKVNSSIARQYCMVILVVCLL